MESITIDRSGVDFYVGKGFVLKPGALNGNASPTAATGTADLYPGFTGGDVYFTITNPNPFPVEFTAMTAGTVVSSDPVNCPAANISVAGATGLSITVPANTTSSTQSIADVVTMVLAAPNGCQGVSFTIPLQLAGIQA